MWSEVDNNEDSNKRRRLFPDSPLLRYPFIMPLLLKYLTAKDVLKRLLVTSKTMKKDLNNFPVNRLISVQLAITLTSMDRYVQLVPKYIESYNGEDIRCFTALEVLKIHDDFNQPLQSGQLPVTLKRLSFGKAFNQSIGEGVLPPQLEHLAFGQDFNQPLVMNSLPLWLSEVDFGDSFDQPLLPGMLPNGLRQIMFGPDWNQGKFNKPLAPGVFPLSVTCLKLSAGFNQPLQPGILPPSLIALIFGSHFNQPLTSDVMPPRLSVLGFHPLSKFASVLFLPATLCELILECSLSGIKLLGWPPSLTKLRLSPSNDVLPAGVVPASVRTLFLAQPVAVGSIPDGVIRFAYLIDCPIPAAVIPNTVTHLDLVAHYNKQVFPGVIPNSLTHLTFGDKFNQVILPRSIPSSVTDIVFGRDFNQVLMPGALPESTVRFFMDNTNGVFDQQLLTIDVNVPSASAPVIVGSIPRSVTHLVLSRDFNHPLLPGSLPPAVTRLTFGVKFAQPLPPDVLPPSLKRVILSITGKPLDREALLDTTRNRIVGFKGSVRLEISHHRVGDQVRHGR